VVNTEMTVTAAAAMATVIIQPESLSRMMVSFALQGVPATGFLPSASKWRGMVAFFAAG
jgi:hypothetical protein